MYEFNNEATLNSITTNSARYPIWLFQRGRLNHRGPFYEAFKRILTVDNELDSPSIKKKFSLRTARDQREYERSVSPTRAQDQPLANLQIASSSPDRRSRAEKFAAPVSLMKGFSLRSQLIQS